MQLNQASVSRPRISLAIGATAADEQQLREGAKVLPKSFRLLISELGEAIESLKALGPDDSPDLILFYLREGSPDPAWVRRLRRDPRYRRTPLIALLEPESSVDLTAYYLAGCNCCVKLRGGPAERRRLLEGMFKFWLGCVVLPAPPQEAS